MNRFARIALALVLVAVASLPAAAQSAADEAAVRAAVDAYLHAHATGSAERLRPVFHPVANLFFVRADTLAQRSGAAYLDGFDGTPAADEAQRKRSIEMIDITGNAAVAKVVLDYPQARFTDYMSLLKVDGEWKIVNKTFVAEPKAKP